MHSSSGEECAPEGEEPGLLWSESRLLSPVSFLVLILSARRLMSTVHAQAASRMQAAFVAKGYRLKPQICRQCVPRLRGERKAKLAARLLNDVRLFFPQQSRLTLGVRDKLSSPSNHRKRGAILHCENSLASTAHQATCRCQRSRSTLR